MSAVNGESSTTKPPGEQGGFGGGFQPQGKMTVQPPKKEDLQRSYASIVGDDGNPSGWYGSMGKFLRHSRASPTCSPQSLICALQSTRLVV